ncbi:hypothetical protein EXIGLDRAFT_767824 [Exidia glandulosa HHB12029]|uniref:Nucleoporin Pom152 n=1 Tax=Exidia glandulosa HHB12029 TaxID=1314781 RepID=A0A165IQ79_EXIGL|nr:hypothetical protein EXIGLDRAFT_767824 [Exidia glandulosa HHB12029]
MAAPTPRPPVISESVLSIPEQRLYVLSFGALVQSLKLLNLFSALTSSEGPSWRQLFVKWCLVDAAVLWCTSELRIPRLSFAKRARFMYILILAGLNWLLFGTYSLSFASLAPGAVFRWSERQLSLNERRVNVEDVINSGQHLIGQHTVRLSPIATTTLNPFLQTFCLAAPSYTVFVPVVFNNTRPKFLQYSLSPLSAPTDPTTASLVELSARELKAIDQSLSQLQLTPPAQMDGELDDDDEPALIDLGAPRLGKTETMHHVKVTKPDVLRLERAGEGNEVDIRIRQNPGAVTIVECPTAQFIDGARDTQTRCVGGAEELHLTVYGVPPLALAWTRLVEGKREEFVVEGIEGEADASGVTLSGSRAITIPLSIGLDRLGEHVYKLESVTDALGNTVSLSSHRNTERVFSVLRRPEVSFVGCAAGKPVALRKGKPAQLRLRTHAADGKDAPWDVTVIGPGTKSRTVKMKDSSAMDVEAREAGDPETCRVAEVPVPSAQIVWEKITECEGDTGLSASLVMHGAPKFIVAYSEQHNGRGTSTKTRTFDASRASFTIKPDRPGSYKYSFLKLSDANYDDVSLNGPTVELSINPVAGARLIRKKDHDVYSCAGSEVEIEVDLTGSAPWKLDVQVGSTTVPFTGLKQARTKLKVPIPKEFDSEGGAFQVDLVSIEDAHGCKRPLSEQGMTVKVQRVKPTVKFYAQDGKRQVTVHHGEEARLPLRLTGVGPWDVKYRHDGKVYDRRVTGTANGELRVRESGTFELIEIRDKHCPGSVVVGEEVYDVLWVPRPTVKLAASTEATYIAYNGSYVRAPVCEGVPDHVDLELDGHAPFKIKYNVARENEYGVMNLVTGDATVGSIQRTMRFALDTAHLGRVFYEIRDVGDARYPLNSDPSPSSQSRLQFEQEILARPSAWFKNSERLSYCLGDALEPLSGSYKDEGTIVLRGTPPFVLDLSIRNLGTSEVQKHTVHVPENEWRLNVPTYNFKAVGQHLVEIEAIRDANGCEHTEAPLGVAGGKSAWVDVAETAAIVPYDRRVDYCVGDVLQFQLEGTPPWRVKYKFKERITTATVKTAQFRRVAGSSGVFSVVSIAHQRNMCQTPVNDLHVKIHEIPSAQVSHGKKVIEDIREGEQAEIVFTLIGEPPFTFTYQRAELTTHRGKTPKVLETHTVTGVMTNEYSIYSALEGTWTVTFISDKLCRYPPAQIDASVEKA